MKNKCRTFPLVVGLLLGLSITSARADGDTRAMDEMENAIFSPIDAQVENDKVVEELDEFSRKIIGTAYMGTYGWARWVDKGSYHKKYTESQIISRRKVPQVLKATEIKNILKRVETSGLGPKGSMHIRIHDNTMPRVDTEIGVVNRKKIRMFITSTGINEAATGLTKGHGKTYLFTDMTKDSLEKALKQMSKNRVKVYATELGHPRISKFKVATSLVAVFVTVDLGNMLLGDLLEEIEASK